MIRQDKRTSRRCAQHHGRFMRPHDIIAMAGAEIEGSHKWRPRLEI
jgi:hypothetical protein